MIVLFDLNGTLTDPCAIGGPWGDAHLGLEVLHTAQRSGMVDALLGTSRPFGDHIRSALEGHVARRDLDPGHIEEAIGVAAALPAQPDADAALSLLQGAGHRLAVLTNSGTEAGERTLRACGLRRHLSDVLGVDGVGSFKPDPATYRYALRCLDAAPSDVIMVAAHAWDIAGAGHVGLQTAWIWRDEIAYPFTAAEPDVRAANLLDAAHAILALPSMD